MSIGSLGGILAGAAGSQLQDQQADNAQGIAETDGKDHGTNDCDADGRRLWEPPLGDKPPQAVASAEEPTATHGKDATGQCGNELDLTG